MDIRWVILARAFSHGADGTTDIEGIFYRLSLPGPPFRLSFVVVARLEVSPLEAGEEKIVTVQVKHERHGVIGSHDIVLTLPGMEAWAMSPPYLGLKFPELPFPAEGEYTVSLIVDGTTKGTEWLTIRPVEKAGDR
jgi:hypothetical protein